MENPPPRLGYRGRYPNWCAVAPLRRRTIGIQTLTPNGRPKDISGRVMFRDVEHAATNAGMLGGLGRTCSAPLRRLRLWCGHLTPRRTRFCFAIDSIYTYLGFTTFHVVC
ncbi:hypothetical protein [Rubripirellula tenax]|uniref:hypothetical protein n=1 Tax=Rubripirellula tenax TaxID=2528015 RepID=UPI0011B5AD0F|nr:hypothetical protein [Rubripirellula tenax]